MPPGITRAPIDKVGYHGFITWDLEFDGVRVPAANQLTGGDEGFASTQAWLNIARVHTAARAVGLARAAVGVTGDGIQSHGGNGYTTEHQVERHWRDARLTTIFEGTSEIRMKIVADRLLPHSPVG